MHVSGRHGVRVLQTLRALMIGQFIDATSERLADLEPDIQPNVLLALGLLAVHHLSKRMPRQQLFQTLEQAAQNFEQLERERAQTNPRGVS